MTHHESKPHNKLLALHIDGYRHLCGRYMWLQDFDLLPRLGPLLIFTRLKKLYEHHHSLDMALIGLRDTAFNFRSDSGEVDSFIVRFTPYGLSRFLDLPMQELTNRIVDAGMVFDEITQLQERIFSSENFDERIGYFEDFMLKRYTPPVCTDEAILELAKSIQNKDGRVAPADVPLSTRQLERRFKALVGINRQYFDRLGRFDRAKITIINSPNIRLTDVGYEAGYYDQAHFSKEFRKFAGLGPKQLIGSIPFYALLSSFYQGDFVG